MPKIAVLIPCYNEELTVEKTVSDFRKAIPEAEIYVYDNNSTDRTAELAKNAGAIVRKEPHQGKGNVVRAMFRDIDADAYVLVDGDDTYPADEVRKLLAPVLYDRADMVIGDRLSNGTYFSENKRAFHEFGNTLVKRLINSFFRSDIKDIMTGYRVFSKRFVKCIPITSQGFQIETEITAYALMMRMNIVEIPIEYRDRPEGSYSKLNTFRDGVKVMITLFDLIKDYKPLYFSFFFFVFFLLVGCASLLLLRGQTVFIIGLMLFMIAVLFLAVGMILDSIKNHTIKCMEDTLNRYSVTDKNQ